REYADIHQVGGDINGRYDQRPQEKAQTDVAFGTFDLAGDEGDVVPGIAAEKTSHHAAGDGAQAGQPDIGQDIPPDAPAECKTCMPVGPGDIRTRPQPKSENDQAGKRNDLGEGEYGLDQFAFLHAKRIDKGQHHDQPNRSYLRRGNMEEPQIEEDMVLAETGKNISGEFGKRYPHGGDRAGLDDREKSPAIQKTHQRAECLFQIDILPSGPGIHTAELAIADGRDKGKYPGEDPNEDEPAGRSDAAGDICADDEDAGADHAADDDHGGIEQAKRSFEPSFFGHQAKVFPGWIDR